MSRRFILPVLSLSALLVAARVQAAPPIQATAEAARAVVQVGEPVRLIIRVTNSDELPQIDAPTVEGLAISSTGTAEVKPSILRNVRPLSTGHVPASKIIESLRGLSKQMNQLPSGIPNLDPQLGQQYQDMLKKGLGNANRSDYAFVYLAVPDQTGPITVPAFTVHSGDQTLETRPIRLTVVEPRPSPWVKAALSLSNPKPFAGDTVNLYVDLLVRRWSQRVGRGGPKLKSQPINHVKLTIPPLDGYPEIRPLESLEQFVRKRRLAPGQLGYHVNQCPGVLLLEQEPPAGRSFNPDPQWYRRRLTIPFRANAAGEVELPPLRVGGEVYVPGGGKNGYDWQGFVASSEPLKFRILDPANRPSDYNGTIGSCRLIASASRTEMPAGTPFTLKLREEGTSNLARVTPPNLESWAEFRDPFVIHFEKDYRPAEHVREFTWTLRPRSAAVTEVPPISVSWFDPKSEKFTRVQSKAIPLKVTPAPVNLAPPKAAANAPAIPDEPSPSTEEASPQQQPSLWKGPLILVTLATFLILCGILVGRRRRRNNPRRQRAARLRQRRQAIEQARQRLHTPPLTAAAVSAAVQDFLRAQLEMTPGEITPEEATEHLTQAGYPFELAQGCGDVLRECALRQFAPGQTPASANDLALTADRLLADVLAAPPQRPATRIAGVDELTRERQAALTD